MSISRSPAKAGVSIGGAPTRLRSPPPRGLRIAGYAALFGIPDAGRDTILPGAFAATLARGERLPLYWQHRPSQRIGRIDAAREDARGLRVIATLDPGTRPAELLGARAVSGLSFGYRARDFRLTPQGRELGAVDLFEVRSTWCIRSRPGIARARA